MYKQSGLIASPFGHSNMQLFHQSQSYQQSPNQQQHGAVGPPTPGVVKLLPMHILKTKYPIPDHVVSDLVTRFVMNIPEEERLDAVRVCFQIELAHWFFVDHYCGEGSEQDWQSLRGINFPDFAHIMFLKIPFLRDEVKNLERIIQDFREYKMKVPTFGAILMDQSLTKVVLVQGFRSHWGFPKGKINKDEAPAACAAREVLEETGYDCSHLLHEDHWVESCPMERWTRLYFIRGVDLNTRFQPHTKYEIKNIGWFDIKDLPECKNDPNLAPKPGYPHSAFATVYPFVKRIKRWVEDKVSGTNELSCFRSNAPNRPDHILDRRLDGSIGNGRQRRTSDTVRPDREKARKQLNKTPGKSKSASITMTTTTVRTTKETIVKTEPEETSGMPNAFQFRLPFGTPTHQSTDISSLGLQLHSMLTSSSSAKQQKSQHQPLSKQFNPFVKTNVNPVRKLFDSDDDDQDSKNVDDLSSQLNTLVLGSQTTQVVQPIKVERKDAITIVDPSAFSISSTTWTSFKLDVEKIMNAMQG